MSASVRSSHSIRSLVGLDCAGKFSEAMLWDAKLRCGSSRRVYRFEQEQLRLRRLHLRQQGFHVGDAVRQFEIGTRIASLPRAKDRRSRGSAKS